MAMFDAKEFMEAMSPPQFRAPDGTLFEGEHMSFQEWMPFQQAFEDMTARAKRGEVSEVELRANIRKFVDAIFPRKRPWWKVWQRERLCSTEVLKLAPNVMTAAVQTFIQSQAQAMQVSLGAKPGKDITAAEVVA